MATLVSSLSQFISHHPVALGRYAITAPLVAASQDPNNQAYMNSQWNPYATKSVKTYASRIKR